MCFISERLGKHGSLVSSRGSYQQNKGSYGLGAWRENSQPIKFSEMFKCEGIEPTQHDG